MKIRTQYFLCSEIAIQSNDTRMTSIVNILEEVEAQSAPLLIQRLSLSNSFIKEDSSVPDIIDCILEIRNNENLLFSGPVSFDFQGKSKLNSIINLQGILVQKSGKVTFNLASTKHGLMANYSIIVKIKGTDEVSMSIAAA